MHLIKEIFFMTAYLEKTILTRNNQENRARQVDPSFQFMILDLNISIKPNVGSVGTFIYIKGCRTPRSLRSFQLTHPERVSRAHFFFMIYSKDCRYK